MKTMTLNKVLALILTACLSTVLSFSSYAASLPVHEQSSEFVPTSKAEYVSTVAKSHGISEEEVLQELESKKKPFWKPMVYTILIVLTSKCVALMGVIPNPCPVALR